MRHNGVVNQTRFLNTSQPQTLVIATLLLYVNAFFNLILLLQGLAIMVFIFPAMALGAFGIANERKWGYALGVAGAVGYVLVLISWYRFGVLGGAFLSFLFSGALVALLLHPMSRDYQKIWFK